MISLKVSNEASAQSLTEFQVNAREAANRVGAQSGGLAEKLVKGVGQLDRFVAAHIQVRTGRTKNSVFQAVDVQGNSAQAGLHSNVKYSPYVGYLPHSKSEQFFQYAARVEGPKVAETTGRAVVVAIEDSFR